MSEYTVAALSSETWEAFARLAERHNGVAWCEFGSPEELPNIYHRKQYDAELDRLPDYRITCIFVDKKHRRKGLSAVALGGAST